MNQPSVSLTQFGVKNFGSYEMFQCLQTPDDSNSQSKSCALPSKLFTSTKSDKILSTLVTAVFDGHGNIGRLAARVACHSLSLFLDDNKSRLGEWTTSDWNFIFPKFFEKMHLDIKETLMHMPTTRVKPDGSIVHRHPSGSESYYLGGTSATVFVLSEDENGLLNYVCANVGDSTCSLIIPVNGVGVPIIQNIMGDHSPSSISEYQRMRMFYDLQISKRQPVSPSGLPPFPAQKALSLVHKNEPQVPYKFPKPDDKATDVTEKPSLLIRDNRFSPPHFYPATRALGDFAGRKIGISFQPTVTQGYFSKKTEFRIVLYNRQVREFDDPNVGISARLLGCPKLRVLAECDNFFLKMSRPQSADRNQLEDMTLVALVGSPTHLRPPKPGYKLHTTLNDLGQRGLSWIPPSSEPGPCFHATASGELIEAKILLGPEEFTVESAVAAIAATVAALLATQPSKFPVNMDDNYAEGPAAASPATQPSEFPVNMDDDYAEGPAAASPAAQPSKPSASIDDKD